MWDSTNQTKAMGEGWKLVTTFNNGDKHPMWDVVSHGPRFKDDQTAVRAVVDAAKRGGAIHQHALKLVTDSRMRPTGKKK
jgi:hypothetical protein